MAWRLMLDRPTMSWSRTIRCPTPPRASASTQFEPTPPKPMTITVAASTRSRPALVMMTSSFSVGVPRRVRTRSDSAISSRVRGVGAGAPAEGQNPLAKHPHARSMQERKFWLPGRQPQKRRPPGSRRPPPRPKPRRLQRSHSCCSRSRPCRPFRARRKSGGFVFRVHPSITGARNPAAAGIITEEGEANAKAMFVQTRKLGGGKSPALA